MQSFMNLLYGGSQVCKGFYLLARDQIIWQKACKRLADILTYCMYLMSTHICLYACIYSKFIMEGMQMYLQCKF